MTKVDTSSQWGGLKFSLVSFDPQNVTDVTKFCGRRRQPEVSGAAVNSVNTNYTERECTDVAQAGPYIKLQLVFIGQLPIVPHSHCQQLRRRLCSVDRRRRCL